MLSYSDNYSLNSVKKERTPPQNQQFTSSSVVPSDYFGNTKPNMQNQPLGRGFDMEVLQMIAENSTSDFAHRNRTISNNSLTEFVHRNRTLSSNSLTLDIFPRDRSLSNNSLILPNFTGATAHQNKRFEDTTINSDFFRRYVNPTNPQEDTNSNYYLPHFQGNNQAQRQPIPQQLPRLGKESNENFPSRQPQLEPAPSHNVINAMQQQQYMNNAANALYVQPQYQMHSQTQQVLNNDSMQLKKPINITKPAKSKVTKPKPAKSNGVTSKYRGVCWYKRTGRWVVQIKVNGMRRHVGYFSCEHEAAKAYDKALYEMIDEAMKNPSSVKKVGRTRTRVFNPKKRKPNLPDGETQEVVDSSKPSKAAIDTICRLKKLQEHLQQDFKNNQQL